MSAAPAATADAAAAPAKGGKKKLIIIIVAVLLLLVLGGGGAFMMLKKKPAAEDEEGGDGHAKTSSHAKAKEEHAPPPPTLRDPKKPPTFVPLDAFTVNLADKDAERYAQIGVTLEIDDPKLADQLKVYMPAIRNNVLMVLSNKTAAQLLSREGKEKLARNILLASVQPLGYPVDFEEDEDAEQAEDAPKKKKKKKRVVVQYPVTAVHFSTFIVQ
ncbi:flagellar basal body-associated FliL family protein [Ideonella sp. DXS22W]|uniref:Flagellar protein FliL n=1 Tax=Pseudaquabacterium inlustre TaxID=2984192 RepID=A0ABU9CDH6_9BURK